MKVYLVHTENNESETDQVVNTTQEVMGVVKQFAPNDDSTEFQKEVAALQPEDKVSLGFLNGGNDWISVTCQDFKPTHQIIYIIQEDDGDGIPQDPEIFYEEDQAKERFIEIANFNLNANFQTMSEASEAVQKNWKEWGVRLFEVDMP
ncbi:hypothetical protein [Hydrogenovibrio marinus]|uniref:Uncharacterized protein n=1 Tax=Hydrogenovibrio marinus TaxID=28885 RepID=A0A066ZMJ0_HYDMR|nr:hypothetical protein [Hydrogenovibrio marinus]KDN94687.1 hypothetical protein EI16_12370 [Hydrogenovibrio marinus]